MKEYITKEGSRESILKEIANEVIFTQEDCDKCLKYLENNTEYLSQNEIIEISHTLPKLPNGSMGYMVPGTIYYINLKIATIVLVAAILDNIILNYSINIFAPNLQAITKLSAEVGEKCVISEIAKQKRRCGNSEILLRNGGQCFNNHMNCKYKNQDQCECTVNDVAIICENMVLKNVLKKKGTTYYYQI